MSSAVVTWSSSAPQVATVAPNGVVTSAGNGTATITASALDASGTATVTVAQVATSISVSPAAGTLGAIGATQQLTVVALDANNTAIAAPTVTWTSSSAAVATVSGTGLVTAVSNGSATITASVGSSSGSATIAVAQVAATVTVTPTPVALASVGATQQLTALTRDANNNAIVDAAVVWSSSTPAAATVSATGLVTAVANGATAVSASAAGVGGATVVGTAEVTVAQAVSSVAVTPTSASLVRDGATRQLTAVARDANNNTIAGQSFTWSSNSTGVASVNSSGLVTSGTIGTATITASTGGQSASSAITVTGVPMAWVLVTQVATAQYTPLASEGTNLSGGSITVARFSTGRYAVVFGGLGTNSGRIGTNWTAMISTSLFQQAGLPVQGAVCNLNSLQVTELRVDVWCENAVSGAAMDAQFRVLVVGNGALAAPMAFTGHTNFAATANYTPLSSLAFSSGGEAQTVGVGASEIVHSYGANVPGNNGVFVQTITPSQGSARTCVVRGNSPSVRTATIWCFNAVGTRDRNITHLFMAPSLGRVGGFQGFAAVNSNGTQQTSRNSSGGSVVTARVGVGSYTVTFNGLSSPGLDGNFAVLVSSAGSANWENCGHRVSNANPITVQIVCVNNAGTQIDAGAAFHVMVLR